MSGDGGATERGIGGATESKPDSGFEDFALEVYDVIRDIRDPEKPETLEELEVLTEDSVAVTEVQGKKAGCDPTDCLHIRVTFAPTVPHCSLATLIGLCIRIKISRVFGRRHKLDIFVKAGSHNTESDINKQINDKERVAAAMENKSLKELVEQCIGEGE